MSIVVIAHLIVSDPAGFLNEGWRDAFAVAGVSITVIGFAFAIRRISQAKSSAEAALTATELTRSELSRNLSLADLGSGIHLIEHIDNLVRVQQLDAAKLRLGDLRKLIVQIRETGQFDRTTRQHFQEFVTRIGLLEEMLLKRHYTPAAAFDPLRVHEVLRQTSNFLSRLAVRSQLEIGGPDADS